MQTDLLGTCALLHDIGKIGISNEILNRAARLTEQEWETMKSHPHLGAAIAGHSRQFASCASVILHHHEKYNGEGYPAGKTGEDIPLECRILSIADAFAAMTTERPYSPAMTIEMGLEEIKKGAGTQFDPKLVEVLLGVIQKATPS